MIGFRIHEVMEGTIQRDGESFDRPFRIDVEAVFPSLLGILRAVVGRIVGSVRIDGLGKRSPAEGTLELSPFWKRLVRYTFDLQADDGHTYHFDGRKTITTRRFLRSWTTLPGTLVDDTGAVWGTGVLRFSFRRHLIGLLASFRLVRAPASSGSPGEPVREPAVHA
jgi:hypothetical protein